jgi:hypothetical protein
MSQSQNAKILQALQAGHCVDGLTALKRFGSLRLAARVAELRRAGHLIECRMVRTGTGKMVGVYRMQP